MSDYYTILEKFRDEEIEVIYRKTRRPVVADENVDISAQGAGMGAMGWGFCPKLNTHTYIAAEGIICDQDQPVTLRDGTVIYTDIYRPITEEKVPVIISWSYYGKRPGDGMSEWQIMGVPPGTVSLMAKFESPDPAYWCHHGYAIANVDPRGVSHSGGDINMYGVQDAKDGYDFVEWLAEQPWCSGKVGMGGNSMVAMTQWRIAAQQPPHLICIAPWEGSSDKYRESMFEGGIPALTFNRFLVTSLTGNGGVDDLSEMGKRYPLMNGYWEDKIPDFKKISIPCYATASWSHFHLRGAFEGFRKIRSRKKWMRVHRDFEWPDTYSPKGIDDLKRFYDRYLKDIYNGWEMTPRVRIEVMDAYDCDYQTERPEKEFPLKRTEYRKLYLNAEDMSLSKESVQKHSSVRYDGKNGIVTFDMPFDEETELTGYMKLHMWVEADGHDDMDLFVNIQKLSTTGEWLPTDVLGEPHPGAWGKLRVSHRALDEKESTVYQPVHSHLKEEKLEPHMIVPIDIEIWPSSKIWHKGQQIRVQIAGHYVREGWFEPLSWETDNYGDHIIHTGGKYDSYLQVPFIPPKYQDGDYCYR